MWRIWKHYRKHPVSDERQYSVNADSSAQVSAPRLGADSQSRIRSAAWGIRLAGLLRKPSYAALQIVVRLTHIELCNQGQGRLNMLQRQGNQKPVSDN